jgi:hypothetical protein
VSAVGQFIYDWQTLIAGLLALVAGVGTVVATIKSANREVVAAQEQTKAAQRQTAVAREIERRRIAREGYAFHSMLEAAMGAVIKDVEAAKNLPPPSADGSTYSAPAYAMRQRVKRTGFIELRSAFLHFGGGTLTRKFLKLDNEIEIFAEQFMMGANDRTLIGVNAGLSEQLDRIQQQAIELRETAKLCSDELAKDLINLEPLTLTVPVEKG